jgi:uridine kinase
MPEVYVIRGCNGSGKTTFALNIFPKLGNHRIHQRPGDRLISNNYGNTVRTETINPHSAGWRGRQRIKI